MIKMCANCKLKNKNCPSFDRLPIVSTTLQVTDRCNESCQFCWHKDKNELKNSDMSEKSIDKLADFLMLNYQGFNGSFTFTGGEPTLNFGVVKYAIEKLNSTFDKNLFTMITNAVVIPNDLIQVLDDYTIGINVSLPSESSLLYNERLENVKKYIELSKNYHIKFMITIDNFDISNLYNIVYKWKTIGVPNIIILLEYHEYEVDINFNDYQIRLEKELRSAKNLDSENFKIYNFDIESKISYLYNNCLQTNKALKLAYFENGDFYITARDKFFNNAPIGSINGGIDLNKYLNYLKNSPCFGCKYKEVCFADISAFKKNNKTWFNRLHCINNQAINRINGY